MYYIYYVLYIYIYVYMYMCVYNIYIYTHIYIYIYVYVYIFTGIILRHTCARATGQCPPVNTPSATGKRPSAKSRYTCVYTYYIYIYIYIYSMCTHMYTDFLPRGVCRSPRGYSPVGIGRSPGRRCAAILYL